jgi:DNA sulfur modification protein DndE
MSEEQQALESGVQAVIYGLPLVIMDLTMRTATNVDHPRGMAAPTNQFANAREFPTAAFKQVVRANVDTLYSSAFLDLSKEPLVLSVPETQGRYYLLPMFDAWTDVFASPGTRTTGNSAGTFVIVGPEWTGTLPAGLKALKSPTNTVWILGRTQTNGPEDYPVVHAVQDGYKLVPLSGFATAYTLPRGAVDSNVDMKTPPVEQLKAMSAAAYFNALARLLKSNPPPASEGPMLAKLARIGVSPGQPFNPSKLDPRIANGLERSVSLALERLQAAAKQTGNSVNGWRVPAMILGNYGSNYVARAIIALIAFGANLPADAVYPTTFVDADGKPLNGANRYTLHFDKDRMPPVNSFWSVTLYDPYSYFVANPINRYAINSWMPLRRGTDGSVELYIQRESPGKDREPNWLPAAEGDFNLTLRMYWPTDKKPSILDGSWKPPAVTRVMQ